MNYVKSTVKFLLGVFISLSIVLVPTYVFFKFFFESDGFVFWLGLYICSSSIFLLFTASNFVYGDWTLPWYKAGFSKKDYRNIFARFQKRYKNKEYFLVLREDIIIPLIVIPAFGLMYSLILFALIMFVPAMIYGILRWFVDFS